MKVLCVCNIGQNRSRIIASILKEHGHDTRYAGVGDSAINPVNQDMVDWADVVVTALDAHSRALQQRYLVKKRVISLDIHPGVDVENEIKRQLARHLPL